MGPESRLLGASETLDDAVAESASVRLTWSFGPGPATGAEFPPAEKTGFGIVWVPYVRFYPLGPEPSRSADRHVDQAEVQVGPDDAPDDGEALARVRPVLGRDGFFQVLERNREQVDE